jgi:hypothetical protein
LPRTLFFNSVAAATLKLASGQEKSGEPFGRRSKAPSALTDDVKTSIARRHGPVDMVKRGSPPTPLPQRSK